MVAALFIAGCSSAPSKFYTLNSTAESRGKPGAGYTVMVGPVSVPMEVDRPQFTVKIGPNRVRIDEFNRWAEPLNNNIARVVAGNLVVLLGAPRVISIPMADFAPDYRVTIDIQRFESVPGKSAVIDAVWMVKKAVGSKPLSGRTVATEEVSGEDYEALAAAHSRALAKVSGDIAAAMRKMTAGKP